MRIPGLKCEAVGAVIHPHRVDIEAIFHPCSMKPEG